MILAQHAIIALCLFGLTTAWWGQGDDDYWDMERSAAVEDQMAGPYEPYGWEPSKPYNPGYDDSKGRSAKERSANRGRSGKRKTAKGRSAEGRSASVEDRVAGPYEPYGWESPKPYNPGYDDGKGRSAKGRSAK